MKKLIDAAFVVIVVISIYVGLWVTLSYGIGI